MTTESILKKHILNEYKSVREFCIVSNFPYSTIDNMFKRGILGSSVSTVIRVCDKLNIDIDELINGSIVTRASSLDCPLSSDEIEMMEKFRNLSEGGQSAVKAYIDSRTDAEKDLIEIPVAAYGEGLSSLKLTKEQAKQLKEGLDKLSSK